MCTISTNKRPPPPPNKNGSYGIRGGGPYAIFWGSVCHIFCRNPLILTDFYAIRTPIVWHILGGIFFANMGGGGGRNYFHNWPTCRGHGSLEQFWTKGSPTNRHGVAPLEPEAEEMEAQPWEGRVQLQMALRAACLSLSLYHLGRTPKGAYSPRGHSRPLLDSPPSQNLF